MGENEQLGGVPQLVSMLRSHVERCLQDVWELPELVTDGDGDYPYRYGTAACWVSIQPGPDPGVRVFAHAAHSLRRSARLLEEVNELNSRSRWARIFWADGVVYVSAELHWTQVDQAALDRTWDCVGSVADDIGAMLATVFGGATPFPVESDETSEDEEAA